MIQQGVQTLDMRHTLPNLKNLMLTLTTTLDEDVEMGPSSKQPAHANGNASPTLVTDADSSNAPTPTNSNTPRKPFFAPLTGLWHLRSGSSTLRSTNGPSTVPSLPPTPELNTPEDSDATILTSPSEPDTDAGQIPVSSRDTSLLEETIRNGDAAADNTSSTIDMSASNIATVTPAEEDGDDEGDTETIKDGSVERAPQQSSWITKAFFGQIDRERDWDREREKTTGPGTRGSGRRKKSAVAASTVSSTPPPMAIPAVHTGGGDASSVN